MDPQSNYQDAIVVGAGLAGLVCAHVLSRCGYRTVVLDKSAEPGGNCNSFRDSCGNLFDYGMHVVDHNRSEFTWRFLDRIVEGGLKIIELNRGLVLKGELVPFNAPVEEWPSSLSNIFDRKEFDDDLGNLDFKSTTRDQYARIYGTAFTDLAFDEIIPSYPHLRWKLDRGAPLSSMMQIVYPWFFPKATRLGGRSGESASFQDKVLEEGRHEVLYPASGGFGSVIAGLLDSLDDEYVELVSGISRIEFNLAEDQHNLESVVADDTYLSAKRCFWCAPIPILGTLLGVAPIEMFPQKMVLGSFTFDTLKREDFHEILVGDPEQLINRISLPAKFTGSGKAQVQIEFLFPRDDYPENEEFWKNAWLESLKQIGLIDPKFVLLNFDFKIQTQGFATVEWQDELEDYYREEMNLTNSNIFVPMFSAGPQNINRIVNDVVNSVIGVLTEP